MKTITKYQATDGSEWLNMVDCARRDLLDMKVKTLESELGPAVKEGRRKIDPAVFARVKTDTVDICRKEWPTEPVFQHDAAEIHPMSYAGRFLSEVGGPLNRLWWRFSCINGEWEYEQPYYALNPDKFIEPVSAS